MKQVPLELPATGMGNEQSPCSPAFGSAVMRCGVFLVVFILSSHVNLAAVGKPEVEGGKTERSGHVDPGVARLVN